MNKASLIEESKRLVASALGLPDTEIDSDSRLHSLPEWDSLGQLQIKTAVEECTASEVKDARMFARLSSVRSIASILAARQAEDVAIPHPGSHPPTLASYWCPDNVAARLVLVHGISADRHEWGFFDLLGLEALGEDVAVLSIDYQGHGMSSVPLAELSLPGIVREIEAAQDWIAKKHAQCYSMVLGNSFGAGLSLIAGVRKEVDLIAMSCAVTDYGADLARVTPAVGSVSEAGVAYSNLSLPLSVLPEMAEVDGLLRSIRPASPVVFFHGLDDSDVPCDEARKFAAALPNAEFFGFAHMDHTYTAVRGQKQRDAATVFNREIASRKIAEELSRRAGSNPRP